MVIISGVPIFRIFTVLLEDLLILLKNFVRSRLKPIFILNKYLTKFFNVFPSHVLELFDKISPILCYGSEVWGFNKRKNIEKVHLQFCKRRSAAKHCTQNDFIYGELGRLSFF